MGLLSKKHSLTRALSLVASESLITGTDATHQQQENNHSPMIRRLFRPSITVIFSLLAGCQTNQPTPAEAITPLYTAPSEFSNSGCSELKETLADINSREPSLVKAQTDRRSSSAWKSFWWNGVGDGDNSIAQDIAKIRGQREAIQKVMSRKNCS